MATPKIATPAQHVESPPRASRRRRPRRLLQLGIALSLVLVVLGADRYLRSSAFRERVREKVVAELEQVTGGKVVLESFRWNLAKLEFEATNLTIHGSEGPEELPYVHVDRLAISIRIISLLGKEIALSSVNLDRPVIHLIVYPDGTTNVPTPKVKQRQSGGSPADSLFDLAMDHLTMSGGKLVLNDQALPLDLTAAGVDIDAAFDSSSQQYRATLRVANLFGRAAQVPPFTANVETDLALSRNAAEVRSLRISTPRSSIEANGSVTDFANPRIQALYKASIDIPEAAALARVRDFRQGKLELEGAGSFFGREFAASGKVLAKSLDYGAGSVRLRDAEVGASYVLTPSRFDLNRMAVLILGGRGSGDLHVINWRQGEIAAPPAVAPKAVVSKTEARKDANSKSVISNAAASKGSAEQQGNLSLELSGFPLREIVALGGRNSSLGQINLAGVLNGAMTAHWQGSPANTLAEFSGHVIPAGTAGGALPVNGSLEAAYEAQSKNLRVSKLDLATRSSHMIASGSVGFREGDPAGVALQCAFSTTDLNEFAPVLRAFGGQQAFAALQLRAPVSFSGGISGPLQALRLRGHVNLGAFDTVLRAAQSDTAAGAAPATPTQLVPAQVVHWDSFSADLEYARSGIALRNAALQQQQGGASIEFDADLRTPAGALDRRSPLNVEIMMRNAGLADIQSLVGYNYPVTGTVNAHAKLSGSLENMNGSGTMRLLDGVIYGEPYKSLQLQMQFSGQEIRFSNLLFSLNENTRVTGSGSYNPSTRSFSVSIAGKGIDLASVRRLQARTAVAGRVQFQADASGTLDAPILNADLHLHGLSIAGRPVGEADITAVTQGRDLKLRGTTELEGAKLALDGHVGLGGDYPSDITVRLDHFDAVPVLQIYASSKIKGNSDIAGTLHVTGPLRYPKRLEVEGEAPQFAVTLQGYQVRSDGPLRLVLSKQVLRVDQFHIMGDQTDFRAQGSVDFAGNAGLNVEAQGEINLRLLRTLDPNIYSSGKTTFTITTRGTLAEPRIRGNLQFNNVQFSLVDLPNGLSNLNGTLVFTQDRLQIRKLTAETGGGTLDISGYVAYQNGLFADLMAAGKSIRVRYPQGLSTVASANFRFTGTTAGGVLGGEVSIEKFSVTPQLDLLAMIAHARQPVTEARSNSPLDNIHLDMHVGAASQLTVETSLARLTGDLDLHIGGTLARPTVLGRANIFEGDINFNGTKYHLERGDIVFNNPVKIMPILNLQASARVQTYDITLGFQGSLEKPNMTYRSDPPLPTADIISLVALGKTQDSSTGTRQQNNENLVDTDSSAILGEALNATINSRVQKLFGGSRVNIDPDIGGTQANPGTHLTVEQQVSNRVTLTYVTNLTQTAQQVIQMEYAVNSHLSILAVRDQNGIVGLSFRVRRRTK